VAALALAAIAALVVVALVALGSRDGAEEPASPRTPTITIPEGYTREQIAEVAEKAGLRGDYLETTESFKGFDPSSYGAGGPPSLEGFLFPSTYELRPHSSVDALVKRQLDALREQIGRIDMAYARSKNLTTYDVLIIASMIEREVQVPKERPLVAAVIYNRLAAGEPLAIDATIRYETGNYTEPLTESELSADSPYNTRLRAGLPPTPIGNPGLDSIEAAAHPARVDYRYYVIEPCASGEHFFTASEEEFNQAAERYQDALEEEGGSPTEC
jgi:UPF0755 protein